MSSIPKGVDLPVESALADVWMSVTGARPAPGRDRVDLLSPLAAVHFLVEMEMQVGLRVPFEYFFRERMTLHDLALLLDGNQAWIRSSQLLVPIQPRGSRPPLFFVHGDEYAMLSLRHFPPALGPEQPLVGLLPERPGRRFDRELGLAGMVPGLLEAVRQVQPHGPYYLCGHSLGGVIAYDMARQLAGQGEPVAWLALADTQTPAALRRFYVNLMAPRNRLRRQLERGPAGMAAKVWQVFRHRLGEHRTEAAGSALPATAFDHEGARVIYEGCEVSGHSLPLDLYITTDGMQMSQRQYLGWEEVHRGSLTLHKAPGDHMTMLSEPNIAVLAEMMAARLSQMQQRWDAPGEH